jgi:protein-S-isoprenylcysteine O-methyltransferase Ste14
MEILLLLGILAILLILPSFIFNVLTSWQIIFVTISYLIFFLGSVWRNIVYGKLISRQDDRQFQTFKSASPFAIALFTILGIHWLAIYDFSLCQTIDRDLLSMVLAIVGSLTIAIGISINQFAIKTLGQFFDPLTIKPQHQLISTGIYSFIRHPIYLSYILLFAGFCITLGSLISLVIVLIASAIAFGNRINIEEKMLVEQFGDRYHEYQQKTKKLLPLLY